MIKNSSYIFGCSTNHVNECVFFFICRLGRRLGRSPLVTRNVHKKPLLTDNTKQQHVFQKTRHNWFRGIEWSFVIILIFAKSHNYFGESLNAIRSLVATGSGWTRRTDQNNVIRKMAWGRTWPIVFNKGNIIWYNEIFLGGAWKKEPTRL